MFAPAFGPEFRAQRFHLIEVALDACIDVVTKSNAWPYPAWRKRLAESFRFQAELLTGDVVAWLWDMVLSEPSIKRYVEDKKRAINDWLRENPALPAGCKLGIYAPKTISFDRIKQSEHAPPIALARSDEPIYFTLRRMGILEVADIPVYLSINARALANVQWSEPEREARAFRVTSEDITLNEKGKAIFIHYDSLNKSIAGLCSRALEKQQNTNRSAYYHVVWVGEDEYVSLMKIRQDYEDGEWVAPYCGRSMVGLDPQSELSGSSVVDELT